MTNVILVNNHAQTTVVRLAQTQDTFKYLFSRPFRTLQRDLQRYNVHQHRFSFQRRYQCVNEFV